MNRRTSLFLLLFTLSTHLSRAEDVTLDQAKVAFAKADATLNATYQRAKTSMAEWAFAELQQDQREWIESRDLRAEMAAAYDGRAEEGKEKLAVEYWTTLDILTAERTRIVNGWINHDKFSHEWEGVWLDGNGGLLRIMQNEAGKFVFVLDVVRGPTYHVGNIGGAATWNGSTARFTTESLVDETETWLTFIKRQIKLEVIGENTSGHHGARAYFDGDYVRVSELSETDRKEILSPAI